MTTGAQQKQNGLYRDFGGKAFNTTHIDSGMRCDSVFDDRAAFDTLVNTTMQAVGVKTRVVDVVGIVRIGSALSIPSNVRLNFTSGSYLAPDIGITVTINGPINHHPEKKFGGGGSVVFGGRKVKVAHPEWWGANDDYRSVGDGTITTGTPTFDSATAAFTADDAGKGITIIGAGATTAGTGTVTAAAGVATFSLTQAGLIRNGLTIVVAGVSYQVSAFNGTTGATLSGAPTFGATAFAIGTTLVTTILAYVSATRVTLAVNASVTVAGVIFTYGTLNTPFHQAAINSGVRHVHSPGGSYMLNRITLVANQKFSGAGKTATTFYKHQPTGAAGLIYADSLSAVTQIPNIHLSGFSVNGEADTKGSAGFEHLISLHGVKDPLLENFELIAPQGDGIYLGSGPAGGQERHNEKVTIRKFRINGVSKTNRNGISIIDCDGFLAHDGTIENIGHPVLSNSVGAIDCEPNSAWNVYRDIAVRDVRFKNIDAVNTAAITFFTSQQSGLNINNTIVSGCSFEQCYYGIQANGSIKTSNGYVDGFTFRSNKFVNSTLFDILLYGMKNVTIDDNKHIVSPSGSASYRGAISLGFKDTVTGACRNAYDIKILNNVYKGLRPQFAVIWVLGARGLRIEGNDFDNISGSCIQLASVTIAGTRRYLDKIIIEKNHVHNLDQFTLGAPVTTRFINADASINSGNDNSFINSTCIERNNTLDHGIQRIVGGVSIVFKDELRAAAPTTGTWNKGDLTRRTTPAAGAFADAVSVAGTAGTLAGATGDATNTGTQLLNVADPNDSLREGQWILVTGDAVPKQIIVMDGTTIWMSAAYTGATGAAKVLAWAGAATWVTV